MRLAFLAVTLALSGCAPRLQVVSERSGMIHKTGSLGSDRAIALANAHCAKTNRIARISGRDILTNTMTFDCVDR